MRGPGPAGLRPVGDPTLRAAYESCRRLHAVHGRTYYLATALLPADRRRHVWALYAFARYADELVDGPGGPGGPIGPGGPGGPIGPDGGRRGEREGERLQLWSAAALGALRVDAPPDPLTEPVLAATWHTARAYRLDSDLFAQFLASMAMDLHVHRYQTWAELRGYMRGSAAVIGEMTAPVLGATGTPALLAAATLGEAFQLTNFVRDVAEDLGRGRVYLPQEDLHRFGVRDADLGRAVRERRPSPALRRLVAFEVDRAQDLYDQARPGLTMVDAASRPCLRVAFELYREILDLVRARDGDVFAGRLTVPRSRRVAVAGRAVAASALRQAYRPVRRPAAAAGPRPRR